MTHLKEKITLLFQVKMFLLACLFIGSLPILSAQSPQDNYYQEDVLQKEFDAKKWEEVTSDIDYSGVPKKVKESRDTTDRFGDLEAINIPIGGVSNPFGAVLFKIVAITVAVAVAVMILLYILNGGILLPSNPKVKNQEVTLENIEDNILETELEGFIREAKDNGDYSLAMRLYYLAIIKELSLKKLIKWKRDKTNGEYLRETRGSSFFTAFRETTNIFENVWYGDGKINKEEFTNLEPKFRNLVDTVAKYRNS